MDRAHSDDFFSCIRSRKRTVLNPELGYQIMTAIKLGVDSYRAGQIKNFDPRTRRVIGKAARQRIALPASAVGLLPDAAGVAVSVEPGGGSPTGQPTGPVVFQGRLAAAQP